MSYQNIARLAELANRLSDHVQHGERVDMSVTYECIGKSPELTVKIRSWDSGGTEGLDVFYLESAPFSGHAYTTAEMIQVLEQIEHYGFREQEQAA